MLELDGSGGGGQLLRTALALSALAGEPFRMREIRGGRSTPGLRPQHLAAVRLVSTITDADVSGAEVGATELEFVPADPQPGTYDIDIGTAGSTTLLFDTVLPLVTALEAPLTVRASGGTDVKWSPTMDYARQVKLPLLRRHGVGAVVDIGRRGFYPEGGGQAALRLWPSTPGPIELEGTADSGSARLFSLASETLADREVAERQARAAEEALSNNDVEVTGRRVQYVDADSPGSAITVRLERNSTVSGGDAHGERGTPAEDVAERAVGRALEVIDTRAAVDRHLVDQLMVFIAVAGGAVTATTLTEHVETNAAILEQFGYPLTVETEGGVVRIAD